MYEGWNVKRNEKDQGGWKTRRKKRKVKKRGERKIVFEMISMILTTPPLLFFPTTLFSFYSCSSSAQHFPSHGKLDGSNHRDNTIRIKIRIRDSTRYVLNYNNYKKTRFL